MLQIGTFCLLFPRALIIKEEAAIGHTDHLGLGQTLAPPINVEERRKPARAATRDYNICCPLSKDMINPFIG